MRRLVAIRSSIIISVSITISIRLSIIIIMILIIAINNILYMFKCRRCFLHCETPGMDIRQLIASNVDLLASSLAHPSTEFMYYLLQKQLISHVEVKKHREIGITIPQVEHLVRCAATFLALNMDFNVC